jgi:hypothetical protein
MYFFIYCEEAEDYCLTDPKNSTTIIRAQNMVFIEYTENKSENTKHEFGLEKNAQPETEPVLLHEQK